MIKEKSLSYYVKRNVPLRRKKMSQTQTLEQNWEDWRKNDKLERTSDIMGFGNILLADKENEVFSLTAPFGFGKTFFL